MRIATTALSAVCFLALGCGTTEGSSQSSSTTSGGGSSGAGGSMATGTGVDMDAGVEMDAGDEMDAGYMGSIGCQRGAGLDEGEHTFTLDGYDRKYILRLPEGYSKDKAWPLIFALHGNGGNTGYWDDGNVDRNIREAFATEAILVIVEAIDNQWRDYSMDASTWPERIELELAYFDKILGDATSELCIDEQSIFSMGFSGGGSFSGVLGCRREYIRAMAVGGSVIYFEPKDCVSTPAAWITIGQGEQENGRTAYLEFFRDRAGCDAAEMPTEGCVEYENCDATTPVIYCTHPAGHVWPSIGTDATRDFFRQFYQ